MTDRRLPLLFLSLLLVAGCGGGSPEGGAVGTPHAARFVPFTDDAQTDPVGGNADGSVVVGSRRTGDTFTPAVWRGAQNVSFVWPTIGGGGAILFATTADGRLALGLADPTLAQPTGVPALFSSSGERTILPRPPGRDAGYPVDLSANGEVALCLDAPPHQMYHPKPYVVRNGQAVYLPLPAGADFVGVGAISGDGRVVVGTIDGWAAVWVDGGQPQLIAGPQSGAGGVSYDGSVVVGTEPDPASGMHAFRWTQAGGKEVLPVSPDYPKNGAAVGVSADGRTVLIESDAESGTQFVPQLWREGEGTLTAEALFGKPGFDGLMPIALSADGHTIVGRAMLWGTDGNVRPWKLTLP